MPDIRTVELLFLLLLVFIIAFGQLARKIGTPYPIVMVIGGLLLGLIPGIPRITLDPDLIFLVVLPPLHLFLGLDDLLAGLRVQPGQHPHARLRPGRLHCRWASPSRPARPPGFDWRLGLVLGAVVAPTDAIAATSIAKRIGLPGAHR
jgi:NhaP-type Na+/H+ or K+/H+ antiporter